MIRNRTGVWGELFAARYLRDNAFEVHSSNFICRFGEIDIVAEKNGTLCFVEVKTRNQSTHLRPVEAVDKSKQERVGLAAKSFVRLTKLVGMHRFDVCEVYLDDNLRPVEINYIENAFGGV